MSHDFASEITKLGLPTAIDATVLARRALSQNRSRIRRLAALTIGLWVVTFLVVPAFWMPFAAEMRQQALRLSTPADAAVAAVPPETVAGVLRDLLAQISMVSGAILGVLTLASLLAAASTVWLVLTVRRVTLEQLALGLAQISEQLSALHELKTARAAGSRPS